jgi:acyl-CoA synthetase (AMP-forming)/AMP-acid ligase II
MVELLPIPACWWELIEQRAERAPEREFLSDERDRTMSFGEYRDRSLEVAAGLLELGVRPGDVVSWQLPTTMEGAVLMAALSRIGARQNPIIPILRRTEVALITAQLQSEWMFVPGTYRGFDYVAMAHEAIGERPCTIVDTTTFSGELRLPLGDVSTLPPLSNPGDDVRWYFYSSGTTATPKGAMHTDRSAMHGSVAQVDYIGASSEELLPLAFPITHIGGVMMLTTYLRTGSRLLFLESFDPMSSPEYMAARGATRLGSATPFFRAYIDAQLRHGDEPLFPDLHHLQAGGAPITPELNAECIRVLGSPIYNQWGLTEFPSASSLALDDPPEKFNGTVGRMAAGCHVKVLDLARRPLADGAEGELWVEGPQRCAGYVDSSLDAESFDADGYFRTGDLGTIDAEGFVRITGRLKDIIIRNAENLSAQEMEDVLSEHPAVADVAVIAVPDARTGERACAVVVLAHGFDTLTIPELATHCQALGLAKQKIPEQLEIVDELPRNPMGKVLKHVLRADLVPRSDGAQTSGR